MDIADTVEQSVSEKLQEISTRLADWRANNKVRYQRIPFDLLEQARALRGGELSDEQICASTGLTIDQFLTKSERVERAKSSDFVEIVPGFTSGGPIIVEVRERLRTIVIRGPDYNVVERILNRLKV